MNERHKNTHTLLQQSSQLSFELFLRLSDNRKMIFPQIKKSKISVFICFEFYAFKGLATKLV